jgi:hypothetical protein
MAFGRLTKAWEGTAAFLKTLKNAEKAKELFTAAKAGEKLTDFGKFMNPFQRTMDWTTNLAKGTNGVDKLGNMAKVTKTFGNFYRDLRELSVAHSEARLEGEGASVEYQNKLVDEFYEEHGRMPNDKEAQNIYDRAESVKASVTLANDLTIYSTNKLVFDDLFEGIRPGSKIAQAFSEGGKRMLKRTEAAAFKAGEKQAYQAVEKSAGKKVSDFLLKSEYVPWSRKYFLGNLSEALQENSQEMIKGAAHDYYDKVHSDPTQLCFYGTMASIGKGTSEQFSGQGLETFLSGYMMGSLIQAGGKGMKSLYSPVERGSKAAASAMTGGKYGQEWSAETESQRADKQREQNENDVLNAANFIAENGLIYGGNRADIASAMKIAAEAKKAKAEAGDEKGARDMQNELQLNQFDILAKTGNMRLITEHVDDMMKLQNEDLINAYNSPIANSGESMTAQQVRQKLQGLKENAEGYQRAYDKAHRSRPNPYNPWMFNPKKEKAAYDDELNKYAAHEQALSDMIFANETYSNIADRMTSLGNELNGGGAFAKFFNTGSPLTEAIGSDVSVLIDPTLLGTHMASLSQQIAVFSDGTADEKKKAIELKKSMAFLNEWRMLSDSFRNTLKSQTPLSDEEYLARKQEATFAEGSEVTDTKTGKTYTVFKTSYTNTVAGRKADNTPIAGQKQFNVLLTDEDGNRVIYDADRHKLTNRASEIPAEYSEMRDVNSSKILEEMYKTFTKYVNQVGKTKNGYVFNAQMNKAFGMLKDFMQLEQDKFKYVHLINNFSDPTMFDRYVDIQKQVQASARTQKSARLAKALDKFKQMALHNKMLNEIFDLGLFVMPEDIKRLRDYNITDFYNNADKSLLQKTDPKYKQALDIIEKYAEASGKMVKEKEILESDKDDEAAERQKYNSKARPKYKGDKRSYKDLAEQFGFDRTAVNSKVDAVKVLNAIINSPHASTREKALARRLLTVVKPDQVITFAADLSVPGVYKATSKETIIDARYSSEDYTKGKNGHPVEHVILHEMLHALTVDGLATDPDFKNSISELLAAAQAYQTSPEFKQKYGNKPLYGTMNEAEFIAEALTNDTFQSMLRRIPYKTTGKVGTAWNEFVNTLSRFFAKLFGVAENSTVLDEALNIITAKIDGRPTEKAKAQEKGLVLKAGDPVKLTTPIGQIKALPGNYTALFDKLVEGYRRASKNPDELTGLSKEDIAARPDFQDYMLHSKEAIDAITTFNAEITTKPKPKNVVAGRKDLISNDQYQDFVNTKVVPDTVLELIADRVRISGMKGLSERETEVYQAKEADIKKLMEAKEKQAWINLINKSATEKELDKVMDQIEKAQLMSPEMIDEIAKKRAAIVAGAPVLSTADKIKNKEQQIADINNNLEGLYYFVSTTDSYAGGKQAQKDIDDAKQKLKILEAEIVALKNQLVIAPVITEPAKIITLESLEEDYAKIQTADDLTQWESDSETWMKSDESDFNEMKEFAERRDAMIEDKQKQIGEQLKIQDLTVGSIVIMADKKSTRIIARNDGESVTLMPENMFMEQFVKNEETGDWEQRNEELPKTGTFTVKADQLKDKIWVKNSDFVAQIEETPAPTEEQKKESNQVMAESKIDSTTAQNVISQSKAIDTETKKKESANLFNQCKA